MFLITQFTPKPILIIQE